MGLLTFASGSHNDMALNYWNSGQKQLEKRTAGDSFYVYQGKFVEERYTMANYGAMAPGDVSFHAGWTIHGGMPNIGEATREAIAVSWVPDQTKMLPAFDVVGAQMRTLSGEIRLQLGSHCSRSVRSLTAWFSCCCTAAKYSSDDKLTIGRLLTLKPGMEVPEKILPKVWSPPAIDASGSDGITDSKQDL